MYIHGERWKMQKNREMYWTTVSAYLCLLLGFHQISLASKSQKLPQATQLPQSNEYLKRN